MELGRLQIRGYGGKDLGLRKEVYGMQMGESVRTEPQLCPSPSTGVGYPAGGGRPCGLEDTCLESHKKTPT